MSNAVSFSHEVITDEFLGVALEAFEAYTYSGIVPSSKPPIPALIAEPLNALREVIAGIAKFHTRVSHLPERHSELADFYEATNFCGVLTDYELPYAYLDFTNQLLRSDMSSTAALESFLNGVHDAAKSAMAMWFHYVDDESKIVIYCAWKGLSGDLKQAFSWLQLKSELLRRLEHVIGEYNYNIPESEKQMYQHRADLRSLEHAACLADRWARDALKRAFEAFDSDLFFKSERSIDQELRA